ncbi:IS21 family transposase [Kangiella sp. TOML190]|uniref:IS21 family transposase n=1 Tax=Kangiella sp. TOML190 TaxID=2931351 RepID=UPI00203D50AC|nr:IS21 family transposase [Kangiella sp. TOML190]
MVRSKLHDHELMLRLICDTNLSNRKIGELSGYSHNTVGRYRKIIIAQKYSWLQLKLLNHDDRKALFIKKRERDLSKRMADYKKVEVELRNKGANQRNIWEAYYDEDPATAYSFSSFTYYYRLYKVKNDISMKIRRYPGEITNVDFAGLTIPYFDRKTNKKHYAQVFVSAIGISCLIYMEACPSQKRSVWIAVHNEMIKYYGGVSEVVTCDNLRPAIDRAKGKYPAKVNRIYAEWAAHCNSVIIPARAGHPQDNACAEAAVKKVTYKIIYKLRSRTFYNIEEINDAIRVLLEVVNNMPFKGGMSRRELFEEFDRPMLRPTPEQLFEYFEWIPERKVPRQFLLRVEGHDYSVPYTLRNEYVETKYNHKKVEFYHKGLCVASHKRSSVKGDFTMNKKHQPVNHQIYGYLKQDYLEWALGVGKYTTQVVNQHFDGYQDYSKIPRDACSYLRKLYESSSDKNDFELACQFSLKKSRPLFATNIERLMKTKPWLDERDDDFIPQHDNIRGAEAYTNGGLH